jgi:hypothetical protein
MICDSAWRPEPMMPQVRTSGRAMRSMATPDGARAQNPEGVADDEPAQVAAAAVPDGDELGARRTQSSERFVDAKAGDAIASLLAVDPADREHELTRIERDAVARRRDQAALRLGLPANPRARTKTGRPDPHPPPAAPSLSRLESAAVCQRPERHMAQLIRIALACPGLCCNQLR